MARLITFVAIIFCAAQLRALRLVGRPMFYQPSWDLTDIPQEPAKPAPYKRADNLETNTIPLEHIPSLCQLEYLQADIFLYSRMVGGFRRRTRTQFFNFESLNGLNELDPVG